VSYVVTAGFVVRTPVDVVLDDYLGAVRAGVAGWERIGSVEVVRGDEPGSVSVRTVVDAADRLIAGRTARQALTSAVRTVGPQDAWRAWWIADGPTWITGA
jgi:hypothetical protein